MIGDGREGAGCVWHGIQHVYLSKKESECSEVSLCNVFPFENSVCLCGQKRRKYLNPGTSKGPE